MLPNVYLVTLISYIIGSKRSLLPMQKAVPEEKIWKSGRKLGLSDNSIRVLRARNLHRNEKGEVSETPEQMIKRSARVLAEAEKIFGAKPREIKRFQKTLVEAMGKVDFIVNRVWVNSGRPYPQQQLSACYVLPLEDSMESIFETLKQNAFLHKWDAGTGFDFSPLRPKGDIVRSTGGRSSGPISFMEVFDKVTETVNEAATRRGGNMGILRVDHPDIEEFIDCKKEEGQLENFNISVSITDKFMTALKKGTSYPLINPRTRKAVRKMRAKAIWEKIVESAWASAEPGLIFIDEINRYNPTPKVGKITATNLCGEQPLLPYESCNLGYINLAHMLKENGEKTELDWKKLEEMIGVGVRVLDNTIEINHYLVPQMEKIAKANRKIGLGIMGFADVLIAQRIPYDSEDALKFAEKLMKFITTKAREVSVELAKQRGNFPNLSKSIWVKKGFRKLRNATVTTIAPTGNSSIHGNCSSGIEPIFAVAFVRKVLGKGRNEREELLDVDPMFERVAKKEWFYSKKLMKEIAESGSIQGNSKVPEDVQRFFVTAHDIAPEWHVKMQAAFQKHTDNAVSKTVNLPNKAARGDVEEVFKLAHKLKCKGVTVYRDGCRRDQVLSKVKK